MENIKKNNVMMKISRVLASTGIIVSLYIFSGCTGNSNLTKSDIEKGTYKEMIKSSRLASGPTFSHFNMDTMKMKDIYLPAKDMSLIYISAIRYSSGVATSPQKLFLNGKYLTLMKENGYYPVQVPAGDYTFTLGEPIIDDEESEFKVSGTVEGGKVYHIGMVKKTARFSSDQLCFFNKSYTELNYFNRGLKTLLRGEFKVGSFAGKLNTYKLSLDREVDFKRMLGIINDKSIKDLSLDPKTVNTQTHVKNTAGASLNGAIQGIKESGKGISKGAINGAVQGAGVGIVAYAFSKSVIHMINSNVSNASEYIYYKGLSNYNTLDDLK